jgi:hypothetical protein
MISSHNFKKHTATPIFAVIAGDLVFQCLTRACKNWDRGDSRNRLRGGGPKNHIIQSHQVVKRLEQAPPCHKC